MKRIQLIIASFSILFFLGSCSEQEHCDACHIALPNADGEQIWDIENPDGVLGGDFCGPELTQAESSSYVHTTLDTLYERTTGEPLPPGDYGPSIGDYEIHCHH